MKTLASSSARRRTISSRVCGSAVAVRAMRGTAGKRSCSSDSCRYSGRKSWPHCDTQCASSTAMSDGLTFRRKPTISPVMSRSGAT